jgi:uncharacterized membrane protein
MTSSPNRLIFLDVLRGFAILLMVQDHAFDWWLHGQFQPTPWGRITEFLGTLAAPLFLFLMGTSLALSAHERGQRGMSTPQLAIVYLRRGLFLVLQGYLVTCLIFYNGHNPAEMGAVDVLHCLGLSMIVLIPFVLARAWPVTLLTVLVAAAISPWAWSWNLSPLLATWLSGSSGISYFPLFPFVVFALAGLTIGQILVRVSDHPGGGRCMMWVLIAVGAALLLLVPLIPPNSGYRFPRPVFVAFSLAVILWLTAAFYALAHKPTLLRPLISMGQAAMLVYVVHHLLGFRLFYHLGLVTGHSWQGQYGTLDPATSCALLTGLLGILWGLAELWLIWRPRFGPAALVRRWAPALSVYW